MKKQKKTIKEEIEKEFDKRFFGDKWGLPTKESFFKLAGDGISDWNEYDGDKIKSFIFRILRQTLQRFIEETKIPRQGINLHWEDGLINKIQGYNEAIEEIHQIQAKWLKENLCPKNQKH